MGYLSICNRVLFLLSATHGIIMAELRYLAKKTNKLGSEIHPFT